MIPAHAKDKAWKDALRLWDNPSLAAPEYTHKGMMKNEIAGMDTRNRRIYVNEKNLEERVGSHFLRPVLGHEIGHYKLCPHSLKKFVRLVAAAHDELGNVDQAKLVENLYADLLINYHLYRSGEKDINNVYGQLFPSRNRSRLQDFYLETFAQMQDKKLSGSNLSEGERSEAKRLSEILKDTMYHSSCWPSSIKEFAKAVKKYLQPQPPQQNHSATVGDQRAVKPNEQKQQPEFSNRDASQEMKDKYPGNGQQGKHQAGQQSGGQYPGNGQQEKHPNGHQPGSHPNGGGQQGENAGNAGNEQGQHSPKPSGQPSAASQCPHSQGSSPSDIPAVCNHQAEDFVPTHHGPSSPGYVKAVQKELKGLGTELSQEQYNDVITGLGLGTQKQATIWFYRDLADSYTLKMPLITARSGAIFKDSPLRCSLEDIAEADLEYSFSMSPKNPLALYRWSYREGEGPHLQATTPDLLLVYDSSSSMPDPRKELSYALLSAMIAEEAALAHGNKVAVLNFSTTFITCDFTNQRDELESALSDYIGGSTHIPGEEIYNIVRRNNHPTHILMITDCQIDNLTEQQSWLQQALQQGRAGGTIFLDNHPGEGVALLKKIGYDVLPIRAPEDLTQLTLRKAGELYG